MQSTETPKERWKHANRLPSLYLPNNTIDIMTVHNFSKTSALQRFVPRDDCTFLAGTKALAAGADDMPANNAHNAMLFQCLGVETMVLGY